MKHLLHKQLLIF